MKLTCVAAIKRMIETDPFFKPYFKAFIFEIEAPAADKTTQQVYLKEIEQSDIYLVLIGNKYGYCDDGGVSPTEQEFDKASVSISSDPNACDGAVLRAVGDDGDLRDGRRDCGGATRFQDAGKWYNITCFHAGGILRKTANRFWRGDETPQVKYSAAYSTRRERCFNFRVPPMQR